MFRLWCSVSVGVSGPDFSELFLQPCASATVLHVNLCFTPRWLQGYVQSSVPALALKPCSSNGPSS